MNILNIDYSKIKENDLFHRYICNTHIEPLLKALPEYFQVKTIGHSVKNVPIYGLQVGNGTKRILLWSQMHGNESTTTKALFDLFNYLKANKRLLEVCTLYVIPILNPDGARAYTRINANNVDLNRDAQDLSQPESKVLQKVFNAFKPNFCFNLHGQRTIFSAGKSNNSAILSFLSPAQDEECSITENRKRAMEIISVVNNKLQEVISGHIGVYDDSFNINCVGDTFQSRNVPTILFEAGHYPKDYPREETRKLIFMALLTAISEIAINDDLGRNYKKYLDIPENKKLFFDIIIRKALYNNGAEDSIIDIAVQFEEVLIDGRIEFIPKIKEFGDLSDYHGHREIFAQKQLLELPNGVDLDTENSIDCVTIGDIKYSLNLTKS